MYFLKRNIVLIFVIAFSFIFPSIHAESSIDIPTHYEQLCKLNKEWNSKQFDDPVFSQKISFTSDEELIQTHLKLVEQKLREKNVDHLSEDIQKARSKNLDVLRQYWQRGLFPKNLYHKERTPYFIDDYGTACAVGYIVIETGNEEFAQKIQRENNYALLSELNAQYPALKQWADANGFTIDELAWIQPAYCPPNPCAPGTQQNVSCYGGYDGCAMPDPFGDGLPSPYMLYWYVWNGSQWVQNFWCQGVLLSAGGHLCIVIDGFGDSTFYYYTITQPSQISVTIINSTPDSSTCNGTATVSASGGVPPYTYQWSDGQTDTTVTGLCANTYNISVTDSNGCSVVKGVIIYTYPRPPQRTYQNT